MEVKIMTKAEEFDRIRDDWNTVYAADPDATVFVSWPWIRGWIEGESRDWVVIGIRPAAGSPFVAFMALGMSHVPNWVAYRLPVLHMGGHPLSDHTGFVCAPSFADRAFPVFASVIRKRFGRWATLFMRDVLDPRLEQFLGEFQAQSYLTHLMPETAAPYMDLPGTWEEYLRKYRSQHPAHHHILRKIRKIEQLPNLCITHAQPADFDLHCASFLSLHQMRFGRKDEDRLSRLKILFRRCFEDNKLWLGVMWLGSQPMASLAAFIDKQKRKFAAYLCGFDQKFAKLSPGQVLFAYSIRYAIGEGFREYDFLRGGEEYKYMFGAVDRFNRNVVIKPRGLLRLIEGVDRRITKGIHHLRQAATLHGSVV